MAMAGPQERKVQPWLPLALIFFVFVSLPSCPVRGSGDQTEQQPANMTLDYLQKTVKALKSAVSFFRRQHNSVNLDAVIGTRIVESSLKVLLENLKLKQLTDLLPDAIVDDIRAIQSEAKNASDEAVPYVAVSQPEYYRRIGFVLQEGLWELNYSTRMLPPPETALLWSYMPFEAFTEKESDDCLTELFGTSGKTEEKCVISDTCWLRMTSFGYSQYSLSHEIFYLQIGERWGCLPDMLFRIKLNGQGGLQELQDTFCANMITEATWIAKQGYPANHQDLFMEQALLCGLYGYWEFFSYNWLDRILSWQDITTGCYRWAGWPRIPHGEARSHVEKREERLLDNYCLCHRTTVAAAALAQYTRFLVENYLDQANTREAQTA